MMAYAKKDWSNGEVITEEALDNIENGIATNDTAIAAKADASAIADMLTKTEAGTTYATKAELGGKAAKGANISTADAQAAAGETITKAEFDAVVTLVNACKAELNKMNA